jgi:predicted N-acyltransferase
MTTTPCVEIVDSVSQLPESARRLLSEAGSLYAAPDWLGYCEAMAGGASKLLLLREHEGNVIGVAPVRRVDDDRVMPLYNLESLLEDPRAQTYPSLVAAVSGAQCILAVTGNSAATRSQRRAALAGAVATFAHDEGYAAVGFLYLSREDALDVAANCGPEFGAPFLVEARTELTGGWADFEGYLATLPSSRRNKIRRERKQFDAAGLTTRVLCGASELGEATARLQLALRERYGVSGSIEGILRDYENLRSNVDHRLRIFLCEKDGVPVGMSLALVDGDHLHVRLAGFDYSAVGSDFAYFNAVYYEPIEWGISHGIGSYFFGTGTYRAKTARGCHLEPLYAVVRWPSASRLESAEQASRRAVALAEELGLEATPGAERGRR